MQDDIVTSYLVEALSTQGRIVRLGPMLNRILTYHPYPTPVAQALAEAVTLAVMLSAALKQGGRFQLQTQSDGPISKLLVDIDAPSRVRALAHYKAPLQQDYHLGKGHLAMIVEPDGFDTRYQGLVALDEQGLTAAAMHYFQQSEQIPTFLKVAVGQIVTPEGLRWRAGGLITQYLPPNSTAHPAEDAWVEARMLARTTQDHELLDPLVSSETLLYRLFCERGVRAFPPVPLEAACRCSDTRVAAMLKGFPPQDLQDMIGDDGMIGVTCEFCATHRVFNPKDYD